MLSDLARHKEIAGGMQPDLVGVGAVVEGRRRKDQRLQRESGHHILKRSGVAGCLRHSLLGCVERRILIATIGLALGLRDQAGAQQVAFQPRAIDLPAAKEQIIEHLAVAFVEQGVACQHAWRGEELLLEQRDKVALEHLLFLARRDIGGVANVDQRVVRIGLKQFVDGA